MGIDNWLVEEEIEPSPDLDVRAVYIKLLEQLIAALREPSYPPSMSVELPPYGLYSVPTVIFGYLDTDTLRKENGDTNKALMQLHCFRDLNVFMKELDSYEGYSSEPDQEESIPPTDFE